MTNIGMNLKEYTSKELEVLTKAVIREQLMGGHDPDSEEYEILKQWEVKIIEARVDVKMKEHIQSN